MPLPKFLSSISRKILLLISGLIIAVLIVFFIWKSKKYKIANQTIATTIAKQTQGFYKISYDSLHFEELLGKAYLQNIHISADTSMIKNMKPEDLPYFFLDVKIASLTVTGVKTAKALLGQQLAGDSIVIINPDVTVYFLKTLKKETKIEKEAKALYEQILGNLKIIKVGQFVIKNVNIKGVGFHTDQKNFDFANGNIQLKDVLIDSATNLDTTRTLFCKEVALQVASFITYDNNRPELRVNNLNFYGESNSLVFDNVVLNRFESDEGDSSKFIYATGLRLDGVNTNEIVKNKNIIVDTISCKHITVYEPPLPDLKKVKSKPVKKDDSTGFRHVYSIDMKHLSFPEVTYVARPNSGYAIGNIAIKINEVKADQLSSVMNYPLDYSNEAEISCNKISWKSKDNAYNYLFQNIVLNSLKKQLSIGSYAIRPFLGEKEFANKEHFQRDRYNVLLSGIALKAIDMKNLLDKKISAAELTVNNVSAKIYRDLQKPLKEESKVGNYPSQMIEKMEVPLNISKVILLNTFVSYREKEALSDSTGEVTFTQSTITVDNVTNLPEPIKKNNATKISFESKALGTIRLKGSFTFYLGDKTGRFAAEGHIPSFDSHLLNVVSVPMALMRFNTGIINSLDFNFTGNNVEAGGKLVMKYKDLKVDVLKRDKNSKEVKKKGIVSLIANVIVKNNNPGNGGLREETPHFDRDVRKSFFNLVWKTIFTGMKKTLGLP